MLFSNGFDMEPASGAKPPNAVVYQDWEHFFMLKCILKGKGGCAELKYFCIYVKISVIYFIFLQKVI